MSSLTICTLKPYNCEPIEVVWLKSTARYHVLDVNGIRVAKRDGYSTVRAAMNAAARFATARYADYLNSPR